jgi:hypothetical protein
MSEMTREEMQAKMETLYALTRELRTMLARTDHKLKVREMFIHALLDPDAFGYAVENAVREEAWKILQGERD